MYIRKSSAPDFTFKPQINKNANQLVIKRNESKRNFEKLDKEATLKNTIIVKNSALKSEGTDKILA